MEDKIENAIKVLADKAGGKDTNAIDAQQYAQAVLNLSNVLVALGNRKN